MWGSTLQQVRVGSGIRVSKQMQVHSICLRAADPAVARRLVPPDTCQPFKLSFRPAQQQQDKPALAQKPPKYTTAGRWHKMDAQTGSTSNGIPCHPRATGLSNRDKVGTNHRAMNGQLTPAVMHSTTRSSSGDYSRACPYAVALHTPLPGRTSMRNSPCRFHGMTVLKQHQFGGHQHTCFDPTRLLEKQQDPRLPSFFGGGGVSC